MRPFLPTDWMLALPQPERIVTVRRFIRWRPLPLKRISEPGAASPSGVRTMTASPSWQAKSIPWLSTPRNVAGSQIGDDDNGFAGELFGRVPRLDSRHQRAFTVAHVDLQHIQPVRVWGGPQQRELWPREGPVF